MIMKQFLRKTMKNVAAYVELFLSAVLVFVIVVLIIKLIGQCFFDIWHDKIKLEYTWNISCRLQSAWSL